MIRAIVIGVALLLLHSGLVLGQSFQIEGQVKRDTLPARFVVNGTGGVKTFGNVSFVIDLAGLKDGKRELEIRRQRLTLADGRPVTSVGYDLKTGIIVGSAAPVDRISVAGVEQTGEGQQVRAIFYDRNNQVIAPAATDLIVFDADYRTLAVDYDPFVETTIPGLDVSILIDSSGSMVNVMDDALAATGSFLLNLPATTTCQIITFGGSVRHLTPENPEELPNCPDSKRLLDRGVTAKGETALFAALEQGFARPSTDSVNTLKLVIVVTDGVNTVRSRASREDLTALKAKNNIRTFVFWAGNHDPEHLQGLADYELAATNDIAQELEAFLKTIGVTVAGMQTLQINHPR